MGATLLTALGLMLVLEALLPLFAPRACRDTFRRMVDLKDGQLRFVGLISLLGGFLLIYLSR